MKSDREREREREREEEEEEDDDDDDDDDACMHACSCCLLEHTLCGHFFSLGPEASRAFALCTFNSAAESSFF